MGSQLRVSSKRLEEPGIKLRTPGYKWSGLSMANTMNPYQTAPKGREQSDLVPYCLQYTLPK